MDSTKCNGLTAGHSQPAKTLTKYAADSIAPPVPSKAYTQHPLSAAFPRMTGDEFQALKDSIANVGVQNPIVIFEGQVLDGWNRYQAALDVGMPCPTVEFGGTDPVDFVRAQNATRRNMTPAQTAMAITAIYQWHPAHRPNKSTLSVELTKSSKQLAEIAGVHINTITQAKAVQTNAVSAVQAAVKDGAIGLPKAAAIAKMPLAQQAAAITKPLPKPAKQKPAPIVAAPVVPPEDAYTPLDAAQDQIEELQAMLAVANMGTVAPEDKDQATNLIAEIRAEIKSLRINLRAVTQSRDGLMNELAQVKRQCISLQAKLKKAG